MDPVALQYAAAAAAAASVSYQLPETEQGRISIVPDNLRPGHSMATIPEKRKSGQRCPRKDLTEAAAAAILFSMNSCKAPSPLVIYDATVSKLGEMDINPCLLKLALPCIYLAMQHKSFGCVNYNYYDTIPQFFSFIFLLPSRQYPVS